MDDSRDSADALATLLRMDGHDVFVAYDAETALRMASEKRAEIGLFDLTLPGMNGYEAARRIRQHPGCEHILLAAVTGLGDRDARFLSADAGFYVHLRKPVDMNLIQAVLEALPQSRSSGDGGPPAGDAIR
jgi:DNA-binding response OmpR family regulator